MNTSGGVNGYIEQRYVHPRIVPKDDGILFAELCNRVVVAVHGSNRDFASGSS